MKPEARDQVAQIVAAHRGRAAAISIAQIQRATGISPRSIKGAVQELRMLGMRIGACRVPDGDAVAGYFLVQTHQELIESLRPYQRQVLTEMQLIQAMLGKHYRAAGELAGQLALDLGEQQ